MLAGMSSQRSYSSLRCGRRRTAGDAGSAALEYAGILAVVAVVILAVCGAFQSIGLGAVTSSAVECATSLDCSGPSGGSAASDPADSGKTSGPAAAGSDQRADGEDAARKKRPATTQGSRDAASARTGFSMPGLNLTGSPTFRRIVWCQPNVGCSSTTLPMRWIGPLSPPRIVWCEPDVGCRG